MFLVNYCTQTLWHMNIICSSSGVGDTAPDCSLGVGISCNRDTQSSTWSTRLSWSFWNRVGQYRHPNDSEGSSYGTSSCWWWRWFSGSSSYRSMAGRCVYARLLLFDRKSSSWVHGWHICWSLSQTPLSAISLLLHKLKNYLNENVITVIKTILEAHTIVLLGPDKAPWQGNTSGQTVTGQ